ncbi:MAG: anti-anti-sigma factor [Myxococcales bacterium]|nr:anti-anti-sigma factor [Myxococcales bacterium]
MTSVLVEVLNGAGEELVDRWVSLQTESVLFRADLLAPEQVREESSAFVSQLCESLERSGAVDPEATLDGEPWEGMRAFLAALFRSRAQRGFEPDEGAEFLLLFKLPLFEALQKELGEDPAKLVDAVWDATRLMDRLGLYTTQVYARAKEEVIARQREELLELSTPVVTLWEGILALPLIGTLDSQRTQQVMEVLLQEIVDQEASVAILDITGVPTVDSATAQHLVRTMRAARLIGAECIISGIRPQIAQTMVTLGIDLGQVESRSTMAGALRVAFSRRGRKVVATGEA